MKQTFDIVIVGAGLTGLTVAALLARSRSSDRLRITVIDAAGRPEPPAGDIGLRVSAIALGSVRILEEAGAWQRPSAGPTCPYDSMRVWDAGMTPDNPAALTFDAAEFAVPHLGYIAENARLQQALFESVGETPVEWLFDAPVTTVEPGSGGCRLVVADGRAITADLIIGADGARSTVRELCGIDAREWPYGQLAFVTHLRPERPHRNTALQRFLEAGPLGMLPLPDGRISVVWSTTADSAKAAMAADDHELGQMLTEASGGVLGELAAAGPRGTFPLRARHASNYVLPGIALLGDAAHSVHPLAGQGANLGLQDAACLVDVIESALAAREHPGDRPVLRRYERRRKGANATMLHSLTMLNGLFANNFPAVRMLRKAGMRLFNSSGPLRDHVVGVALGAGR